MAASCPNRNRGKRTIPPIADGGHPNCTGRLMVALRLPVLVPLKSARDDRPETMLTKPILRRGVRVDAATVVKALGSADVRCSKCAYSRRALLAATTTRRSRSGKILRSPN